MTIAMVVAGAGAMYCGACARDASLARALSKAGHDVAVFPIYTPLRVEGGNPPSLQAVSLGGINAYLRECHPSIARFPGISRLLDRPGVLTWASQFAVRTQASDLGGLTMSFLKGLDGPHASEMRKLAVQVAALKPDVVVLANSMLLSLAQPLMAATNAAIVVQVQGEDGFLDELPEPWRTEVESTMRSLAGLASAWIAPCRDHAVAMAPRIGVALSAFVVVPPIADLEADRSQERLSGPVRLGHLSSIRRAKGLDLLVDALGASNADEATLEVAGRVLERGFHKEIQATVERIQISGRVSFVGEVTPAAKGAWLAGKDLVVLPSRLRESRGIAALEALVAGTPVLAPASGIFPELAEKTPAVRLFSTGGLRSALEQAISEIEELRSHASEAPAVIATAYSPAAAVRAFEAGLARS